MAAKDIADDPLTSFETIHRSKITIPPTTGIFRPALVAKVEQGVRGRLTVVSAPAGWGKSTLLAEWASQTGVEVTWISLDEDDHDPARFFRLVVAALQTICPVHFSDVAVMLRSAGPVDVDVILREIVSRLEEMSDPIAVVFDDIHLLSQPRQSELFATMMEWFPANVHLIVSTRGTAPVALARLRADGSVLEIGIKDLAFTPDEADDVFSLLDGPSLGRREVESMVERTEGWIAGLRLAAMSLRANRDPASTIARLRGTHQDIADYFHEEVLGCLERDVRLFLIKTSVLDRFCVSLCEAVTGEGDAHVRLHGPGNTQLFLVPLDEERIWYRYHGLFRDMLRAEFDRLPGEQRAAIHRRASIWFDQHTMIREAVNHAMAAHDTDMAATLIDRHADRLMFMCGETNLLVRWIEQLPEALLHEQPNLRRVFAWALTTVGRVDQAELVMERVCDASKDRAGIGGGAHTDARAGELAAVRARIAAYRGDHPATIQHGRQALELLDPIHNGIVRSDVVLSMGFAQRALGNFDGAAEGFAEAARLGRLYGNEQAARWGVRYLATTRVSQGRLREAEAIVEEDLDRVRPTSAEQGSVLAALLVAKAEILIERHQLGEVRPLLDKAISLIQRVGDAKMLMNAYVAMSILLQAEGKYAIAQEKLRRGDQIFPIAVCKARHAWLALVQGNTAEAQRWAKSSVYSIEDGSDVMRGDQEQIVFARITALCGRSPVSLAFLDRLIKDAERNGRYGHAIELHNVRAVAAHRGGDESQSGESLLRALTLARTEGYVQTFLQEGPDMRVMLRAVVRNRHHGGDDAARAYAMELLSWFGQDGSEQPVDAIIEEPLTPRQREILRLLAEGRSNRQIAQELFIAEGTVKAHMHQLFGKLMVRNRTEAVAAARDLRLLA